MIKCHECGKEISSEAKSCPHCGATLKQEKNIGCLGIGVLVVVSFLFFITLFGKSKTPEPPLTPAAQAAKEELERLENNQLAAVAAAALSIKQAARNPDSVHVLSAWVDDPATTICLEYVAQNGFGGMNRETIVFVDSKAYVEARAWNKHCSGKALNNRTQAANKALKIL